MKYICIFLGMLLLVGVASATFNNFQDPTAIFSNINLSGTGTSTYIFNSSGGNNYFHISTAQFCSNVRATYIINNISLPMTYAAANMFGGASLYYSPTSTVNLYDSGYNVIYSYPGPASTWASGGRVEMRMIGGEAYIYLNGVYVANSTYLNVNPSYVGFGDNGYPTNGCTAASSTDVDDVIWGSSDPSYIYDMPPSNYFIIKKDLINPANSGLAFSSNGTIVNSNLMPTSWAKSNGNNDTLYFANLNGVVYATAYTGTTYYGQTNWNLNTALFNSSAPYGQYQIYSSGSSARSTPIEYISSGASISFNQKLYTQSDVAQITYSVANGYWLPNTYNYKVEVLDAYGNVISTQAVNAQSGSVSYAWSSSNNLGVYYTAMIATPTAGGSDVWMNYDYATLTAYIPISGVVINAVTNNPIANATVNVTQGLVTLSTVSSSNGTFTNINNWLAGSPISVVTNLTGYTTDTNVFVSTSARTVNLTIPLMPITLPKEGVSIGGLIRDNVFGNPIPGVLVTCQNATYSDYNTNLTNIGGFYQCGYLQNNRLYNVSVSKTGYYNTTIVQKTAVGS